MAFGSIQSVPTEVIVVDANIIIAVVLGTWSRHIFDRVIEKRAVATSFRARHEVRSVLGGTPGLPSEAPSIADALLDGLGVMDEAIYADRLEAAAQVLRHAVASRNGSTSDAHLLACAWCLDADIWTHDRDFAGTGWRSWSSANLDAGIGPAA